MHQLFDMSGRVAVVTGSTKGMGLAIARAIGTAGAKVVLSGRNAEAARAAAEELGRTDGITARGLRCDIGDAESVRRFAQEAHEAFGRVDALVLNAAPEAPFGSLLKQTPADVDGVMSGYLNGNLLLIQAALPEMIARKDGSIVLISSAISTRGSKVLGLYGMAKAASDEFVRNLVAEVGPANVNVNSINPSTVRTEFSRVLWETPEAEQRAVAAIPLGRLAEPDEVAGLALLLVSPAGRYINGQSIFVDGGRSAV